MTDWSATIGDMPKLQAYVLDTHIGRWMTFWITKLKDDAVAASSDETTYQEFTTLEQLLNPRKKDEEKYTWNGTCKVAKKGEDGKSLKVDDKIVYEDVTGDHPVKNFIAVGTPIKRAFVFLLSRFFFEAHNAYVENNNSLGTEEDVLRLVRDHSLNSESPAVAAMIINAVDNKFPIDLLLNDNDFQSDKFKPEALFNAIKSRVVEYFKNKNTTPSSHIGILVTTFIRFMKLFAVLSANSLYEKKTAMTMAFFNTQMRTVYSLVYQEGLAFNPELMSDIDSFITTCEEAKKAEAERKKAEPKKTKPTKKADAEEDADEDQDEDADADAEEVEEPKPAPKTAAAPAATNKKPTSRKPAATNKKPAPKQKPPAATGDDFDDIDEEV